MPNKIRSKQDLTLHLALKDTESNARKHTLALMELFNVMGSNYRDAAIKGMTDAMTSEHRYIQQEFMMSLQTALGIYAKTGNDARNIAGVCWAKEASELVPAIPVMGSL